MTENYIFVISTKFILCILIPFPCVSDQGWSHCDSMDMNRFYETLVDHKEHHRVENIEPFDEYEEWHLKCSHYMVVCGHNGNLSSLIPGK